MEEPQTRTDNASEEFCCRKSHRGKADAELIFFQVQKMYSTDKAQYFVFKNLLLFWNKTHKEYKTEKYSDNKITVTTIQVKK